MTSGSVKLTSKSMTHGLIFLSVVLNIEGKWFAEEPTSALLKGILT